MGISFRRDLLRDTIICVLFVCLILQKSGMGPRSLGDVQTSNNASCGQQHMQQQHMGPPQEEKARSITTAATARKKHAGLSKAAKNQFCPFAQCNVTSQCHPCKRRYLILIAQGRSASTTLQNMFHSLPGIRMSGENNNMLGNFMTSVDATREFQTWKWGGRHEERHKAWGHEPVPRSDFACVTQQMAEIINPPPPSTASSGSGSSNDDSDTIVGFKTIRFVNNIKSAIPMNKNNGIKDNYQLPIQEVANFLTETFPCSKIVINIRSDVSKQRKSMKKTLLRDNTDKALANGNAEDIPEVLEHNNKLLIRLAKHLGPQRAHVLDSSDWTTNVTALNEVVTWLGFAKACHFTKLFQFNVEGNGFGVGGVAGRRTPAGCHKLVSSGATKS